MRALVLCAAIASLFASLWLWWREEPAPHTSSEHEDGFSDRAEGNDREGSTDPVGASRKPDAERSYRLAGTVRTSQGRPVEGARYGVQMGRNVTWHGRTASDGGFRIGDVRMGQHVVYFSGDGYVPSTYSIWSGDESFPATLYTGAAVEGTVVLADCSPAAAQVGCAGRVVKTDAAGRFRVDRVNPGSYYVYAYGDDGEGAGAYITLKEGETKSGVRIQLRAPSFVRVEVVGPDDVPREGVAVSVLRAWNTEVRTDRVGLAVVRCFEKPGKQVVVDAISNTPKQMCTVSVSLTAAAHVHGAPVHRIRLPRPVHAQVEVRTAGGEPVSADIVIGKGFGNSLEGWFLDPAKEYDVRVWATGYLKVHLPKWKPEPLLRITLHPAGRIVGRVRDAADNAVPKVQLQSADSVWTSRLSGGAFDIGGLPDERILIAVSREDRLPGALIDVTPKPGRTLDLGTITLREPVEVSGRVVDEKNKPLGGARVIFVAYLSDGPEIPGSELYEAITFADGTFRFQVPHFLTGHLRCSKPGYGTRLVAVFRVDGKPLRPIVLAEPGDLVVTVLARGSKFIRAWGGRIGRKGKDGRMLWDKVDGHGTSGRFKDVEPGRVFVEVFCSAGRARGSVEVKAGESVRLFLMVHR